eukprot:s2575_g10.t1
MFDGSTATSRSSSTLQELKNAEEVTIKVRRQEVYALERARMMKQAQILASLSNLSGAPGRLSSGNSVG